MKYGDLIHFEQIESVIQLLDADRPDEGEKLVSTYVVSEDMADRITKLIIPQLSFDPAVDHKGVLIVGNYGTGKSHLMSVLSLVAENGAYAPKIRHPRVAEAAETIAGSFKVLRLEVGGLEMPLRQIITQQLERFLEREGVYFTFPTADQELNNKNSFEEMMEAFAGKHPDKGLLIVIDEFLEYLQSRRDHELVRDLAILRQIGEVTKHLRFRFLAGVQEAIFDSVRFQHVADSMRRVNERFTQILIDRQDVSFVVSARLLRKTVDQQERIRSYLTPFSRFYGSMNERMDEYVRLFPVHPDYLKTFEQIRFTEKRGALKTIESAMLALIDGDVPTDRPALIAYESYWQTIKGNSVLRADPSIKEVLRVAEVLESRIQQAFTRPAYKAMALRVIAALAVHRLTTGGDIYVPIGPTAEELRDGLCLFQPGVGEMPGEPAENLLSMVQTVLREIMRTVNGQFISKAQDTEQYFLDLKKDVDYDSQIEKRAEALSDDALDRAYFSAVKQLMERTDEATYVAGHQIWQYPLEWQEHRVERTGYLFFGAPNDRPTAQPERDFYMYFVQPFDPPRFRDESKGDEVFFRLKGLDDDMRGLISKYAASLELALTASGGAKATYMSKSQDFLRGMGKWLQDKQLSAFEVTYQGKSAKLQDWAKGVSLRDRAHIGPEDKINFRDVVNVVAGLALGSRFAEAAPEYPTFPTLVSESSRKMLVGSALRLLAGGARTKDAIGMLDALELLDGDRVDIGKSRYAQDVLSRLKAKGHGQVLNRSELVTGEADVEYYSPIKYRLEPDLLLIVLASMVYTGDVVLSVTGDRIDSGKLGLFAERQIDDLIRFKHIEAPKEINVAVLRSLYEFFGLAGGWAQKAVQGDPDALRVLQDEITARVPDVLRAGADIQHGKLSFWGQGILPDDIAADWQAKLADLKSFLEDLAPYNTLGKLKNLRVTQEDIDARKQGLAILKAVADLSSLVADLGPAASYLSQAALALPPDHPWVAKADALRTEIREVLSKDPAGANPEEHRRSLERLKREYIAVYVAGHGKARLGVSEDRTREALRKDQRLVALRSLAAISLMPAGQLTAFEESLSALRSCSSLDEPTLASTPICPHCLYRPSSEQLELIPAVNKLRSLDDELDKLIDGWTASLIENLDDPFSKESIELLAADDRKLVNDFLSVGTILLPVTPEFVTAIGNALSGLERIDIRLDDLRDALIKGGAPASADDLKDRLAAFLEDKCKGREQPNKLRFVIG